MNAAEVGCNALHPAKRVLAARQVLPGCLTAALSAPYTLDDMCSNKPTRSISFDDEGAVLSDSGEGSSPLDQRSSVLSVRQLSACIRAMFDTEEAMQNVWVRGEVSNLNRHSSGHIYFSLKDESAAIRCVIWSNVAKNGRFEISDGMKIIVRGRVTVYERQGYYQITVNEVTPDGVGALYVAYEQLKARLQAEGLFEDERKIAIPRFSSKVAVVTSRTAAALRDIVTIAARRWPTASIILVPSLMQGDGAEDAVVEAIRTADALPDVDVVIVARGGGSIEDLWTFNTESVARAIAAAEKPVVSAIGHETDYTLADFVADLRAPTPSAAAELVFPDSKEVLGKIAHLRDAMTDALRQYVVDRRSRLEAALRSRCFAHPEDLLRDDWQTVDAFSMRISSSAKEFVTQCENRLGKAAARLDALSPLRVLARGYAVVRRLDDGRVVHEASNVAAGDVIETLLSNGRLISEVKETHERWD